MHQKLFVANWKMSKSFAQELDFCTTHFEKLRQLGSRPGIELVICPSFPAIFSLAELLQNSMVGIGAQQCSPHKQGAYTGQVSAQSLQEAGCQYCIVGHSEQRALGTTPEEVAEQTARLFEQKILPIICVGETKDAYESRALFDVLTTQLKPVLRILKQHHLPYAVAYEPIWSIGTGLIPTQEYLQSTYEWLDTNIKNISSDIPYRLLYGGSITENTIQSICAIREIGGFLIGGASLDFKKLENIVSLATQHY